MSQLAVTAELVASVRLSMVEGIGPRLVQQLLERFASPAAVLQASAAELQQINGIGGKLAGRIVRATDEIDAEEEMEWAVTRGIDVITRDSDSYPRMLREIPDPPVVLYRRGTPRPQDVLAIAVVGTRHPTSYGRRQAERLAAELSRAGLTVVSGLARGIDGVAHRGALSAGGRTIAVLGSGLDNVYPAEHRELAQQIAAAGWVCSEAPPRRPPLAGAFPQRNRILSGLCCGTVVVEAPLRSGALITARLAAEQGREVFAVPGPVDSRMSRGTHGLLRDGAALVETADDVLEQLGPLVDATRQLDGSTVRHPGELQLNPLEQEVLQAIDTTATSLDAVVQKCGLATHRVLATVSVLEMRRLVRRLGGNRVVRI